jgi:adenylate cyclase class IV
MQSKTNLELKNYCTDFAPIRQTLKELGAKKIVVKKQKDYFLNLPEKKGVAGRLKIRLEGNQKTAVYYTRPDFASGKGAVAAVELLTIKDKNLLPYLQKVLGVRAVVEKTREMWKKDTTIFNLDTVKNVGKVFEIELQKFGALDAQDRELFKKYQRILTPHLGKIIKGSNADLVPR